VLLNNDGSPLVLVPESDPRANITHHTFNDVLPVLTPTGAIVGFLTAILVSMIICIRTYLSGGLHAKAPGGSSSWSRCTGRNTPGEGEAISRLIIEQGTTHTTNIPIQEDGKPAGMLASMTISRESTSPPSVEQPGSSAVIGLLAPDEDLAGSNQSDKSGIPISGGARS
jgi:hypothetical protein